MAKPTAITEAGGAKVVVLADSTVTTPNAKTPSAVESAASGEATYPVGWQGVATHRQSDNLASPGGFTADGNGPVVCIGGIDDPQVGDPVRAVECLNEDPISTDYGMVTRNIPSGTQTVSGSVTVSGTVTANAGSGTQNVQIQTGSNQIGKLASNSGVDIGDVDVTSVTPGTSGSQLGKAVNAVAGGTDTGVAALAVRDDALSALPVADGDYTHLRVSSTGALHVTGGGGGTEYSEDDATPATIIGTATMMERDDALSTLTPIQGDWASLRCTSKGAMWVEDANSAEMNTSLNNIESDTGNISSNTSTVAGAVSGGQMQVDVVASLPSGNNNIGEVDVVGDVAHNGIDSGKPVKIGGYANSSAPGNVANGDRVNAWFDRAGRLAIHDGGQGITVDNAGTFAVQVDNNPVLGASTAAIGKLAANSGVDIGDVDVTSVVPGTGATNLGKAAGSAAGATDTGVAPLCIRDDALTTLTDPEGDYVPLRVSSTGALHVKPSAGTDGGWDTASLAIQRGILTGATATTDQTLLAADASNLYNVADLTVTIHTGTTAPGVRWVSLYHGTSSVGTEFARIYASNVAGEAVNFTQQFRMPDRGSTNQAVTAKLSGSLGTSGQYSVNVHAYKTST